MSQETKGTHLLEELRKLRVDSTYGKKKHFNAADRKSKLHNWFGLPAVVINIIVGSMLFGLASGSFPNALAWIGAGLILISTILIGIQTYFNFNREVEGHRRVANRYLSIAKECSRIEARYKDNQITIEELTKKLDELAKKNHQVNLDAESYSTNDPWRLRCGMHLTSTIWSS